MAETGFFATNRLVKVCLGLENFSIESEAEKNALLRQVVFQRFAIPAKLNHTSEH